MDRGRLLIKITFRLAMLLPLTGLLLFLPAGSLYYWEAWVYCGMLFIPMIISSYYLVFRDPEFLERRMKTEEKEKAQKIVQFLSGLLFTSVFVISGLDYRFEWSNVPLALVIISDVLVLGGFLYVFRVFQENRYAARTIEVEEGQTVISSGPYAVVRHPMYLSVIPMYLFTPLALGSYWALVPALPLIATLILRILNEEVVLLRDLPGYDDYRHKVRWRLIPGVW
jgi:protein-S-isoprenylcysteine O-methyltransferase Ste14